MDAFLSNMEHIHGAQHQLESMPSRDDWSMFLTPDDVAPILPLDKPPTPIRPRKKRRLSPIDEDACPLSQFEEKADSLPGGILHGYFDGTDFSEGNWLRDKEKVQPTRSIEPDCYRGEMVGRGDFASVFTAGSYLTASVSKMALKISRKVVNPRMKGHFIREAQALAKAMNHPNIIGFHGGTVRHDDHLIEEHTIMTELCDLDLQKLLGMNQKFPERRLCRILRDISSALSHIHSLGIVHMDVKPANILTVKSEVTNREVFKLADFGMATRLDGKGDDEQGTARYMDSGFGKIGWQVDKADVYSLGVCICDLCMGCEASQFSQDLEKARGDGIPGLSIPLQNLVKDMLAVKRQDRPSALEVFERTKSITKSAQRPDYVDTLSERCSPHKVMANVSNSIGLPPSTAVDENLNKNIPCHGKSSLAD